MTSSIIPMRIAALRKRMNEENIDAYYVNTADAHQSEYIAKYYQTRAWLSGFTGSAGYIVVTQDEAHLWADGRYYIEAERAVEGTGIELMRMGQKDVPNLYEHLKTKLPEGGTLGFDGRMLSQKSLQELEKQLADKSPKFRSDVDLVGEIWDDRPSFPDAKIYIHDLKFTGQTAKEKLDAIREKMTQDSCDASLMVSLDNIAWTTNLRGGDVSHTPVFLSYLLVTPEDARLFVDTQKLSDEVKQHLRDNNIDFEAYSGIDRAIKELKVAKIQVDTGRLSSYHYSLFPENVEIHDVPSYAYEMKARLNETEMTCTRAAMIRDSAVVTQYLNWVKQEAGKEASDEFTAQNKLTEMRQSLENFIEESFPSISAYGPNAAMMHYSATEDKTTDIKPEGLYLIDCGAQFYDGTTDITRTIALGPITDEMRHDFTYTLKGHINLARTNFLEGRYGDELDVLARSPLWDIQIDYKSGTGHGIGYVLGVHEGPQGIARGSRRTTLKEGMVLTIEPGVYKTDKFGIRLENDYVVVPAGEDELQGDKYLKFDCLTFVPFDRDAIDASLLSKVELAWINDYHAACYEKLQEHLPEEDLEWLKEACAPLTDDSQRNEP